MRILQLFCFCAILLLVSENAISARESLVLRDLSVIETQTITFDQYQVKTADGKTFGWDQVFQSSLKDSDAERFDRFVKEQGVPLFRLRHKLSIGEFAGLGSLAEPMFEATRSEPLSQANSRQHYLVALAAFQGRKANGQRERSLIPLLDLCAIHRQYPDIGQEFGSANVPDSELLVHFSDRLVPIWFDKQAATQTLRQILSSERQRSEGLDLYIASLQIATGALDDAKRRLDAMSSRRSGLAKRWLPLVQAELQLARGQNVSIAKPIVANHRKMTGSSRALANFLVGMQFSKTKDRYDQAVLELLYIPANFGEQLPGLSAAALYEASQISSRGNRVSESGILRDQLRKQFPNSYFGKLR